MNRGPVLLNRDELQVNPSCFGKCAQVGGIRGEEVVTVGG
jgi:hypothetical protein